MSASGPGPLLALEVPPGPEGVRRVHAGLGAALDGAGPAVAVLPVRDGTSHVERQWAALAPGAPLDADAVVALTTSGSSGDPVGVMLGADALSAAAGAAHEVLAAGPGRWVVAMPVTAVGGLMTVARSIDAGLEPVAWSGVGGGAPFTPDSFLAAAREALDRGAADGAPTYVSLVPTQLGRVMDDPAATEALASMDHVLVGAAALPSSLRERARSAGVCLTSTYGATETCGGVVYDGVPLPGVSVELGDAGRIALAGATLASGYRHRPDLTAAAFVDGRFVSADVGEWSDGRLRVLGRVDDVVKVGGRKVSLPAMVDAARSAPGVSDAAAVAVADAEWGSLPVLVVVGPADEGAVRQAVRASVGPCRMLVRPAEGLPYLPNGKVDRRALRTLVEGP